VHLSSAHLCAVWRESK